MSDSQSELRDLVARAIDGDLSRAERRALFAQLGADPTARHAVAEVAALENDLAAFGAAYDAAAPAPAPRQAPRPALHRPVWLKPRFGFPAGLMGGAVAAALAFAFYGQLAPVEQAVDRLEVFALGFGQQADLAHWSHEHALQSGHAARLTISAAASEPFHLRLSGDGNIDLQVEHRRKNRPAQQDRIGGAQIHYAVLRDPQVGDEVVFRNTGNQDVKISLATGSAGAAQFERQMAAAGPAR